MPLITSLSPSRYTHTTLPQPPDFLLILFDESFVIFARRVWSDVLSSRSCEKLDLHFSFVSLLPFQGDFQVNATEERRQVSLNEFHIIR